MDVHTNLETADGCKDIVKQKMKMGRGLDKINCEIQDGIIVRHGSSAQILRRMVWTYGRMKGRDVKTYRDADVGLQSDREKAIGVLADIEGGN